MARNLFVRLYRQHALDYFHLMGGAGRYQCFHEWHPALLTLGCALQATGKYSFDELGFIWSRLPFEIVNGCDGLREKLTRLFTDWHEPFEVNVNDVKAGADLLVQELSVGSRGTQLSDMQKQLLERVKLEFDLALGVVATS